MPSPDPILAIHLYAELLLNIHSLTLSGTIRSAATAPTLATLTTDGSLIRVQHEGHEACIRVPAKTIGSATATLDVPANCTEPISARVQLEGDLSDLITLRDDHSGNIAPWAATALSSEAGICCAGCDAVLVKPGAVRVWKDLPSEGWAEMMDFWHCHKPDVPSTANGDVGGKGYAAGNRVAAVRGVGMTDNTTFLLAPEDCAVITHSPKPPTPTSSLHCPSCNHPVGAQDPEASGYRLYKWHLSLLPTPTSALQSHPLEKWLSTHLLTTSEARGVRKFLLRPNPSEPGTLLWLFTPDLYFCSATSAGEDVSNATRSLKILRRRIPEAECAQLETASSVEVLDMPEGLGEALMECLERNTALLPEKMRAYQEWTVSVLRRFSVQDLSPDGAGWTETLTDRGASG